MGWVPSKAWLTKVGIAADADRLTYDLAVDATGNGRPSVVAAGFVLPAIDGTLPADPPADLRGLGLALLVFALGASFVIGLTARRTGPVGPA